MSKRKWYTKAIYLGVALALCLGLIMVPAVAGTDPVTLEGSPDHCLTPLTVTFNATAPTGVATYTFTWNYQYHQFYGEDYKSYTEFSKIFAGAETEIVTSTATSIQKTHTFTVPGYYQVQLEAKNSAGDRLGSLVYDEIRTLGILPHPIAYDVKGATQRFEVKGASENATIEWRVVSELSALEISPTLPATNSTFLEVKSMTPGDAHIYADITGDPCGDCTLHCEKKWGDLDHTVLDVYPETTAVDHEKTVIVDPDAAAWTVEEWIKDKVYASFELLPTPVLVGDAMVQWWLFEDSTANQGKINSLMDYLAAHEGALDDAHWAAHGKYTMDELADEFMPAGVTQAQPVDVINYWAKDVAAGGLGLHADTDLFRWDAIDPDAPDGAIVSPGWYAWNTSPDSFPAEDRGIAQAQLSVNPDELEECEPVTVMIVVLVSYPGGATPFDGKDPFNGENIICLEKGKKTFHKTPAPPPPTQVKVPQARWAGEKIVLEKDWGTEFTGKLVMFALEEGSIGDLIPVYSGDLVGPEPDSRTVFTAVQSDGVARVMFKTEQQGEVDVECVLYNWADSTSGLPMAEMSFSAIEELATTWPVVGNHGFLVYYLALESLAVNPDVVALPSPVVDADADVAVQVKGWFTSDALPGSGRLAEPLDLDGDEIPDIILPADRYVLPDDWPVLAGNSMSQRPQYDLMDNPTDEVTATAELGPYDGDVRTPTVSQGGPGEAEAPCIGPFNTLQPWSSLKMWIATASVPADYKVATPFTAPRDDDDVRNTVVPNGELDWFDCPMPQGLVIFNVDTSSLTGLDKGTVLGYGVDAADNYITPFYAVEIPSHEFIPLGEYLWDSWGRDAAITDGPYDYWGDLSATPISTDPNSRTLEVYCDNHGIAGVTIDALSAAGKVTLTVTADFPYLACKYPPITREIEVDWIVSEGEGRKGDFDNDGDIDFDDFVAFSDAYGVTSCDDPRYDPAGDFDSDGDIDFDDFVAFSDVYGT